MRTSIRYQMVLPVIVVLAVLSAKALEKRISRTELPAAVQKTADEQSKGAAVRGYSKETENGQMEYEVELVINGHSKDVTIAPSNHASIRQFQ